MIFKVFIGFVTILLLFSVLDFWLWGMGQSQVPDQGWNQLLLHLKVKSSPPDHQGSPNVVILKRWAIKSNLFKSKKNKKKQNKTQGTTAGTKPPRSRLLKLVTLSLGGDQSHLARGVKKAFYGRNERRHEMKVKGGNIHWQHLHFNCYWFLVFNFFNISFFPEL